MKLKRYITIGLILGAFALTASIEIDNSLNGGLHDMSRCETEIEDITLSLLKNSDGLGITYPESMTKEQFREKVDDCIDSLIIVDGLPIRIYEKLHNESAVSQTIPAYETTFSPMLAMSPEFKKCLDTDGATITPKYPPVCHMPNGTDYALREK